MVNLEFLQYEYFGNTVLNYLYTVGIIVGFSIIGSVAKGVVHEKLLRFAKKTRTQLDDLLVDVWKKIAGFLIFMGGLYLGLGYLHFESGIQQFIDMSIMVLVTFKVTLVIQFLFDSSLELYLRPLANQSKVLDDQFILFFRKLGNVIIWILSILFVVANMGVNITSLITGLGIGGLALALGAQETISNIFAALSLLGDRPFRTGDWAIIDGKEGMIQELGLRSVKMKSFDGTDIIIPTKHAAGAVIENVDRRNTVKVNARIAVDNNTPKNKLEKALDSIRKYFKSCEKEIENYRVNFVDYDNRSLNLLVTYWVKESNNWNRFLSIQTDVNLMMKEIFDKEGVKLSQKYYEEPQT